MARSFTQTLSLLPFLIFHFSQGWIIPGDSSVEGLTTTPWVENANVLTRQATVDCAQDISDPDTPPCRTLCTPSSYTCSSKSIDKRQSPEVSETLRWAIHNVDANASSSYFGESYENHLVARRLSKRAFKPVAQRNIRNYLPAQFESKYDKYFGRPTNLVELEGNEETDATVVQQIKLGDEPFAVGSRGLHGCTIVTIVSSQAVYMGHFWEVPSVSGTRTQFVQRVLNWFSGSSPAVGSGPRLDPTLFPADPVGGTTRVYIMAPRKTSRNGNLVSPQSTNYRSKIPELIQTIRNALNNQDVPIALYNYIPLEYQDDVDYALVNKSHRGITVFQFDPKGHGENKPGWRLFYENRQFQDTDPAPGADSVNGIPDV